MKDPQFKRRVSGDQERNASEEGWRRQLMKARTIRRDRACPSLL